MKKLLFCILITNLFLIINCKQKSQVPIGKWQYKLLVNNEEIGSAIISNKIQNNTYIYKTDMTLNAGTIKNTSTQIITETTSFRPMKYELYNKIINRDNEQDINTIANFDGSKVELIAGKLKSKIIINKKFYLSGNYFISKLLRNDFKKGTEIKAPIYDPSIEAESALASRMKILGEEKIQINGKDENLIHVIQVIDKFKSIDYYMDKSGVAKKIILIMLNSRMEMVIK